MLLVRILLLLCLLWGGQPALAHENEDQPEDQYLRDAHVDVLNGNFDRAIKVLEKLLKKNPRSKEAWFGIGDVYFHQFKWAYAAESYKNALIIDDKYSEAWYYLGKTYFNWLRRKEGINAFEKYLEVAPQSGDASKVRAWIKMLKDVEDIDWYI